jgi:hypothetical protein
MFGDTDAETERVYRELWAALPLERRIEIQRAHQRWVQSIARCHIAKRRAAGLDVTMLEANLERSVTERLERHGKALDLTAELRNAKRIPEK